LSDAAPDTKLCLRRQPCCRLQFNQNAGIVEVQVFAKKLNTQKERVTVAISANHLKIEIRDEACQVVEYGWDNDLYQPIDVEQSKWSILSTQVNIRLKKLDGSIAWPDLGKTNVPVCPVRLSCDRI
jgi:hypothetical protein